MFVGLFMNKIQNEKYLLYVIALIFIGQRIYRIFFTDFIADNWFDNIGVFGVSGLIILLSALFWDKIRPYFE